MWRLLGVLIGAAGCRAAPCSEAPASSVAASSGNSEVASPAAAAGACTLTREGARARAQEYLAGVAGTTAVPSGFSDRGPCRSHCGRGGREPRGDETCASWECPYWYGPPGPGNRYRSASLEVHVIGCGARAFTGLRLAACFARPHRCAARVDREAALAIAAKQRPELAEGGQLDGMFLRWSPEVDEFAWVMSEWRNDGRRREVVRVGAHAPAPQAKSKPPKRR